MKLLPNLWSCNDKKEKDLSVYPMLKEKQETREIYSSPHKMMMILSSS